MQLWRHKYVMCLSRLCSNKKYPFLTNKTLLRDSCAVQILYGKFGHDMHMIQAFYQQLAQKNFNVVSDQQIALSSTSTHLIKTDLPLLHHSPGSTDSSLIIKKKNHSKTLHSSIGFILLYQSCNKFGNPNSV